MCLPSDPTAEFSEEIKPTLNNALCNSIIDEGEYKYLLQTNPVRPAIFTLPKIHKRLDNPPGRTILSGNKSITEPLSQFFDCHIKELVYNLLSFLKDMIDFLHRLNDIKEVDTADMICTVDGANLYTSIPHQAGLTSLQYYLQRFQVPHSEFLVSMTYDVLTKLISCSRINFICKFSEQ